MQKIHVKELRVGHFLVEYGEGTFYKPIVQPRRLIESVDEIRDIIKSGVTNVFINPEMSEVDEDDTRHPALDPDLLLDTPPALELVMGDSPIPFHEEIAVARKVYARAVKHVEGMFDAVREGMPIDHDDSEPLVREIIDSVMRNDAAATSLAVLRRKSEYLYTHSVNVSVLAAVFGKRLGLLDEKIKVLAMAGLYLDIGKAKLDERILNKPGKLTDKEFEHVKWHPVEGYQLLREHDGINEKVLEAVIEHHERYDGTGYPRSLGNRNIAMNSHILAIVDAYDAMTSDRPYKQAVMPTEALKTIYADRGKHYHPEYVELFIKSLGIYPVGSFVRLSDGRYGVVSDISVDLPLCPTVKVVFDQKMRPMRAETVDIGSEPAIKSNLVITDCLDPYDYKIEIDRFL